MSETFDNTNYEGAQFLRDGSLISSTDAPPPDSSASSSPSPPSPDANSDYSPPPPPTNDDSSSSSSSSSPAPSSDSGSQPPKSSSDGGSSDGGSSNGGSSDRGSSNNDSSNRGSSNGGSSDGGSNRSSGNDSNGSSSDGGSDRSSGNGKNDSPSSSKDGSSRSSPFVPDQSSPSRSSPQSGALSPPIEGKSSSRSSGDKHGTSEPSLDVNPGIIIGVAVGVGVFIILLIAIVAVCSKKKKRKGDPMQYYDHGHGPKGGDYYNSSQQPTNWQNGMHGPGTDQFGRPPPSGSAGSGWPSPPPMSGDMTMSGNYTGGPPLPPPSPSIAFAFSKSTFTYDELAAATGGFAHGNLLGQGGFGYVHKGVLPNGKEVAVKSLKVGSGQGEREFMAEVEIISRVHHRHLVSLVGFCIAGGQRMLVYEFVPNNTLEHHLHGKGLPVMDWPARLRIGIGSAKGLAYLHEDCHPKIIHRDIKSANILIDANFEAMVADFGLAKLSSDNHTHVSTRVMGTFGYLAPEYASSGKLTEKSDVFSFGVMLLELITGKRPVDPTHAMEDSLVDWARPLMNRALGEGIYDDLVDMRLENEFNTQEMARMVACAAAAIRHSARKRPKMSQIVRALEGDVSLDDLNEGIRPGQSSIYSGTSSEYDSSAYQADMSRFRKLALSNPDDSGELATSSNDSREMNHPGNQRQQQQFF
ncbi:proline-rich receptor-like protein kinase PERK4 [Momordica charantia]|uniref:non-specific serine/threonine protein kinase n=1 Tax=Momordica charantia TaxID=3673 RepID=A0A6J1C7H0_MOMCH|nr:proline-rich receptor-like protein kinase PERK4 [Momordica charantia]XP_022136398.1 proline-rich receptor-like protein kinase PERK4 [Momordica charantia]